MTGPKKTARELLAEAWAVNEEMWTELTELRCRMDVMGRWLSEVTGQTGYTRFQAEVAEEMERRRAIGKSEMQ